MEEHRQMVEDCMARESRMSEWEQEFMQSLAELLAAGRGLTDRQAKKLSDIWDKVTEGG